MLGDQRKGVGLRADGLPDIDWVEIPEVDAVTGQREFIYQEDSARQTSRPLDRPLCRHYRQFQAFLEVADGFYHDEWWTDLDMPDGHRSTPGEQNWQALEPPA